MMIPGGECRCGPSEDDVSFLMENSSCGGRCQEENQFLVPAEANLELDVHKRNLSTVASPVILLFDGFHNLVYHFYLATRYLLSMVLLLMRIAVTEILKPADRKSSDKAESNLSTNITENKLAQLENSPELLKLQQGGKDVINVINEEAETFAVQHRVNKLKQHHRRAFELISRALKIDEEVGNKDERTVELYKKGINELEKGILLQFSSQNHPRNVKECNQAQKLQHKMKLNLDMAKKRLDYHLNQENKKSQSVLRHLSLPRNSRPPAELSGSSKVRSSRKEERRSCYGGPYTPQPARKTHKRCLSSSETNSLTRNRRNSNPTNTGLSSSKKHGDNSKFMKIVMSEMIEEAVQCRFGDIAGQELAKQALQETVILPSLRPELFTGLRTPTRGLLLFGPPGNGKTMLARAVASESDRAFFNISASSLTSKFVGEGEKLVRSLFTAARQCQPSIIFIDEIDSLLCERSESEHEASRRLKTEFLLEFDGLRGTANDKILVMGATNRPQDLDDAVLRRFSKRIYVKLPGKTDRVEILLKLLKQQYNDLSIHEVHQVAQLTAGFSGSDLTSLAKDAAYGPIRELKMEEVKSLDPVELRKIDMNDFLDSMKKMKKSVSPDSLVPFETWNNKFGEGSI